MTLNDLFEECFLDQHLLTQEVLYEITNSLSDTQIAKQIDVFLRGIGSKHKVPGNVVYVLSGIGYCHKQEYPLTPKQRLFAVVHMIMYWSEIDLITRAEMML